MTHKYVNSKKEKLGYIDFYKRWVAANELPIGGLCSSLPRQLSENEVFEMIKPTKKDIKKMIKESHCVTYWASGSAESKWGRLTPLRETLLILAALLNDEKF